MATASSNDLANVAKDKRLTVSGLTPSISSETLAARFAPFGSVKIMEGVGLKDANGDPRKFAFLTLETTDTQFTRCMNLLNGTKWKGAKLRIGEARPDWTECIKESHSDLAEKQASEAAKLKKKKRKSLAKGKEAADMSLTTLDNVGDRKGWNRTPLDHLIKPVVMRPAHPLPHTIPLVKTSAPKDTKDKNKRSSSSKVVEKRAPSRARRTVIDPARYGAVHLTAASGLLGAEVFEFSGSSRYSASSTPVVANNDDSSSSSSSSDTASSTSPPPKVKTAKTQRTVTLPTTEQPSAPDEIKEQIQEEKNRGLDILASLLGNSETLAWEPDSDLEELALANSDKRQQADDDDEEDTSEDEQMEGPAEDVVEDEKQRGPVVKMAPLKDMFAPHAEEGGFSIFSNLDDMELELDDGDDLPSVMNHHHRAPTPPPITADALFDPNIPLFFPLPRDEYGLAILSGNYRGPRPKDLVDVLKSDRWAAGGGFWRTETDEELKQKWDEVKVDLTAEYKKRYKDAMKRTKRHKRRQDEPKAQ